jgi:hypothetical protein
MPASQTNELTNTVSPIARSVVIALRDGLIWMLDKWCRADPREGALDHQRVHVLLTTC